MPLYEYDCPDCRADVELLVRSDEQPVCPECGGGRLERRLSVPAPSSGSQLSIADPGFGGGPPPCGMGGCGRPECG